MVMIVVAVPVVTAVISQSTAEGNLPVVSLLCLAPESVTDQWRLDTQVITGLFLCCCCLV